MSCVVLFPGQGSQRPAMGRDFDAASRSARFIFDESSEALGVDVRALCAGRDARLTQTDFLQPALLTVEMAMLRHLATEYGLTPTHYGGHSLGEYSALVAAGVIELAAAVRLVHQRGRLMCEAAPLGVGAMTALMARRLDIGQVETCLADLCIDIAAVNASGQIVLSGRSGDLCTAEKRLREVIPGLHLQPLRVTAPFHSRLMTPAEPRFRELLELRSSSWRAAGARVVTSNFTGGFHVASREALVDSLTRQLTGRVRWMDNAAALVALEPSGVVEIGPSSMLRHAFLPHGVHVDAITSVREATAWARHVHGAASA